MAGLGQHPGGFVTRRGPDARGPEVVVGAAAPERVFQTRTRTVLLRPGAPDGPPHLQDGVHVFAWHLASQMSPSSPCPGPWPPRQPLLTDCWQGPHPALSAPSLFLPRMPIPDPQDQARAPTPGNLCLRPQSLGRPPPRASTCRAVGPNGHRPALMSAAARAPREAACCLHVGLTGGGGPGHGELRGALETATLVPAY